MSVAVDRSASPATPARALRTARILRAAFLVVSGLAVTFTAQWHEQLSFDRQLVAFSLAAFAVAHFEEWITVGKQRRTPVSLLLAVVALAAVLLLNLVGGQLAFAVILAAWALASGLLEFIGGVLRPQGRRDATLMGALGVLLALLVLLAHQDAVAMIGFFGGYGILAGVFLGIAAFDSRGDAAEQRPVAE